MKRSYTRHAWMRVHERLSLTPAEVAEQLDAGLCVNIGKERGTYRIHRLFYSVPDRCCFVAIEDERNQVLITLLPVDFHENIAWSVSVEAQNEARSLVAEEMVLPSVSQLLVAPSPSVPLTAAVFRLFAYYRVAEKVRVANLRSWPAAPYLGSVGRLLDDDAFFDALTERLAEKGLGPDSCDAIYVQLGRQPPTRIAVQGLRTETARDE